MIQLMQEFGDKDAQKAALHCAFSDCGVNFQKGPLRPVGDVIKEAQEHDNLGGEHEGVVVRRDNTHPLTSEEGAKVWFATGWVV